MNSSHGVKVVILNNDGKKEKIFHERRNYEDVADAQQPKAIYVEETVSNIKSGH